jgi:hypothetical protein
MSADVIDAEVIPLDALSGAVRIGPLPEAVLPSVPGHLRDCGIRMIGGEGIEIRREADAGGVFLVAEGPGVQAHLVADDGIEASLDDVERFARRVLPEGGTLEIRGRHGIDAGQVMLSISRHEKRGGMIVTRVEKAVLREGLGIFRHPAIETFQVRPDVSKAVA